MREERTYGASERPSGPNIFEVVVEDGICISLALLDTDNRDKTFVKSTLCPNIFLSNHHEQDDHPRTYLYHGKGKLTAVPSLASKRRLISLCLKPDGVQRALVGKIITRFEERGYKLVALKLVHATTEHLEKR